MTKYLQKISAPILLGLAILIATVPFLDLRVLRMAGDEKVYITQALEMARNGRWFVQTLADEPSYFKGPLHYILVRVGMLVFGERLIAGTWMNCVFALMAGITMFQLSRRRWKEDSAILLALAVALNVGIFSHLLASQMEVELSAFYTFAIVALGLGSKKVSFKYDLLFWISTGMAGWVKSPLHSVLIAVGGLLFWTLTGGLIARAKSPRSWLAALCGVAVGVAGYLPAFIFDQKNFVQTYLGREQFEKGNNGRTWDYVLKPLIHFSLPWTFVVIASIVKFLKSPRLSLQSKDSDLVKLGLAMCLPTFLFWCTWSYKGQNYNLPALPALLLFSWAVFSGSVPAWAKRAVGVLGVITLVLAIGVIAHFSPLPDWWSRGWLVLALGSMATFAILFLTSNNARALVVGSVFFFLAFGAFITPLGEREMIDAHQYVKDFPDSTLHYYNLDPSIWSEWAILELVIHHPVFGLHREAQLPEVIKPGHAVIVQNKENLRFIENYWHQSIDPSKAKNYTIAPWTRWLTKGTTPDGVSRWKVAWQNHDLRQLEREFFIIQFN